jgi:hypothetical protein
MLVRKVSRMGAKMRVVYLPTGEFRWRERIRLKAVSKRDYIVRDVAKMGKYLVAVIPTAVWDIFPAGSRVSVKRVERGGDLSSK